LEIETEVVGDEYLSAFLKRHALDIREHYERKLERANNLYMELSAIMLQLEVREKELMRYVNIFFITVIISLLLLSLLSGHTCVYTIIWSL